MKTSLSFITVLCVCVIIIMRSSALDTFPSNFVVGKTDESVTLRCERATDEAVIWKFENQLVRDGEDFEIEGKTVKILKLDLDLSGNFTCWSQEQEVDYTYVLLDMSDSITGSPISCTAETFNCTSTISCTMREKGYKSFRLRDERNADGWLKPSSDGKFYLTHTTNPFAEEATPIVVIGEGRSDLNHYFNTSYSFYIRDIIRPGCPCVSVLKRNKDKVLDLRPPVTWILPLSYYPLDNQVEFQSRTDGKITQASYTQPRDVESPGGNIVIPRGTSKLRARCRDSLLLSQWSEWTAWENVGKGRGKNAKKQKRKEEKKKKGHKNR